MRDDKEMTPTNQDIVDAAKRAGMAEMGCPSGILYIYDGPEEGFHRFRLSLNDDTLPGSAIFIAAGLAVLPKPIEICKWRDGRLQFTWGGDDGDSVISDTLAFSVAHALVDAFPESP